MAELPKTGQRYAAIKRQEELERRANVARDDQYRRKGLKAAVGFPEHLIDSHDAYQLQFLRISVIAERKDMSGQASLKEM